LGQSPVQLRVLQAQLRELQRERRQEQQAEQQAEQVVEEEEEVVVVAARLCYSSQCKSCQSLRRALI
jgi:hypothetical protein